MWSGPGWRAGAVQPHGKRSPLVFQAGMFSIVPTIISVGSGVALMGAVSRASAVLLHLLHGLQSRSHPTNCTCINRELSSATWSFSTSSRRKTRIESGSLKDAGKRSNAARFYQYNTNTFALPGNCWLSSDVMRLLMGVIWECYFFWVFRTVSSFINAILQFYIGLVNKI